MDPQKIVGYFGVTPGMKIADFGSGAGYFTILLAKMVGDTGVVTAIDLMDSALDTLRAKAKTEGLRNVDTVRSNLEVPGGSGLNGSSQDMVLLANILFQNENKAVIIDEAARVIKLGGTLVVIDWKRGTNGFGPPDTLRSDPEEIKNKITSIGFQFTEEINAGLFHFGLIFKKL